jgi:hypothetical protein
MRHRRFVHPSPRKECFIGNFQNGFGTSTRARIRAWACLAGLASTTLPGLQGCGGGAVETHVAPVLAIPVIVTQPASSTVDAGQSETLSVSARGDALVYDWYRDGQLIVGATGPVYSIASVTDTDAGDYDVTVANGAGSVTSAAAIVTVVGTPPVITAQPLPETVPLGGNATFSVTATGAGLLYRWFAHGVAIDGASGATLTLTAVDADSAGAYQVVVSNADGSVTSAAVDLVVGP